jgi:hypothetical protein
MPDICLIDFLEEQLWQGTGNALLLVHNGSDGVQYVICCSAGIFI